MSQGRTLKSHSLLCTQRGEKGKHTHTHDGFYSQDIKLKFTFCLNLKQKHFKIQTRTPVKSRFFSVRGWLTLFFCPVSLFTVCLLLNQSQKDSFWKVLKAFHIFRIQLDFSTLIQTEVMVDSNLWWELCKRQSINMLNMKSRQRFPGSWITGLRCTAVRIWVTVCWWVCTAVLWQLVSHNSDVTLLSLSHCLVSPALLLLSADVTAVFLCEALPSDQVFCRTPFTVWILCVFVFSLWHEDELPWIVKRQLPWP